MSRYVLLDIGGTSIKTALFDKEMGEVKEYPTDAKKGADKLIEKVIEIISSYDSFEAIGILKEYPSYPIRLSVGFDLEALIDCIKNGGSRGFYEIYFGMGFLF